MSSNHCLIRHRSSSTNRHRCRTRHALCRPLAQAGRAQPRDDIDGHGDHGDHGDHGGRRSNGPCRGRGGFADAGRPCGTAWHCQPPRTRRLAAAGPQEAAGLPAVAGPPAAAADPPDCQAVPVAGRPPTASAGRTALSADAAAASQQMISRASTAMQPLQPSTVHDE